MRYFLAFFILMLFNGSAQLPAEGTFIDPLDIAIDKAKMEGNRLQADDAKKNQEIDILLSERSSN